MKKYNLFSLSLLSDCLLLFEFWNWRKKFCNYLHQLSSALFRVRWLFSNYEFSFWQLLLERSCLLSVIQRCRRFPIGRISMICLWEMLRKKMKWKNCRKRKFMKIVIKLKKKNHNISNKKKRSWIKIYVLANVYIR